MASPCPRCCLVATLPSVDGVAHTHCDLLPADIGQRHQRDPAGDGRRRCYQELRQSCRSVFLSSLCACLVACTGRSVRVDMSETDVEGGSVQDRL